MASAVLEECPQWYGENMIASKKITFGTDGWRAVMAREFTFDNVALVAQSIADHVNGQGKGSKGIVIGYDARFLSEQFAALVADILGANGIPAYVVDRDTPTPVVAYTIKDMNLAGAVMLSASHNPPEYHGIKFIPDYLHPALPADTDPIVSRIAVLQENPDLVKTGGPTPTKINPQPAYFAHVRQLIDFDAISKANLTICVDPLYAAGRGYLSTLLEEAGVNVHTIHNERNPLFGGSLPEPNATNLRELGALVRSTGSQIGLSMDGDADRFGMVDETGTYITSNDVLQLTAWHWAQRMGTGAIVRSVATSGRIDAIARQMGVEIIETPVGFKWVGAMMKQHDAIMGGEESGGLSVRGHIPEKDGIVADLVLTEMVAKTGRTPGSILAELREQLGTYIATRIDLRLPEASKVALMDSLRNTPPTEVAGHKVVSVNKADGVKLLLDDNSWLLIRPSGTEPLVRAYMEATSEAGVAALKVAAHTLAPDGVDVTH